MKGIKFGIVASFLLAVAALAASGVLFQRYRTEQEVRSALETENIELQEESNTLQTEIVKFQEETARLREQIKGYVDQRETLKAELDRVNREKTQLAKQIEELESEKNSLLQKADEVQVTEEALLDEANKLATVSFPAGSATLPLVPPPVKEVTIEKKKVEPVTPPQPAQPSPVVEDQRPDQVLSVNRKFNFVVVNMGLRSRLKIGDTLRVEQNGKLIGRIQVEKLYENFSACTILEEIKPAQIQEGDLVRIA